MATVAAQVKVAFSWVPFYEELATKLLPYRTRQGELIQYLESLRAKNFVITTLEDWDETGRRFLMEEIDPFTFFGVFNRNITVENRIQILEAMKAKFGIAASVPGDFSGLPILNNMKSWYFPAKNLREPDHVAKLWRLFELALEPGDPLVNPAFGQAFDAALALRVVNFNITMGLFWIRPHRFVSLDNTMRTAFAIKPPPKGLSFAFYKLQLEGLKQKYPEDFATLSYKAWTRDDDPVVLRQPGAPKVKPSQGPVLSESSDVWFVGAWWEGVEPQDQTTRFLSEGIWENGYEDKYLDVVKTIKVGDVIAIKAATTQAAQLPFDFRGRIASKMVIKALGTVVANRQDGRTVEVDWQPGYKERDWYFYTYRRTVTRADRTNEMAQKLIRFAVYNEPQDYDFFLKSWKIQASEEPYSIDNAIAEGVFLDKLALEQTLNRLRIKKNLILQGAPGVGKTFLARRLAYALMECRDDSRIVSVQFHPSFSYEDFVRGYRPTNEAGKFELADGPLLRLCASAEEDRDRPYVLLIDEINRAVVSQVFGEFLTLMEADKRGLRNGVTPLYRRSATELLSVPENVYLIATMNIADRSLALVDYALRRRFAFVSLQPQFDEPLRKWLAERGMATSVISRILSSMQSLNKLIESDGQLGAAYKIGHSYFCPLGKDYSRLGSEWLEDVLKTEIEPLLEEYWYDSPEKVQQAKALLKSS
jgi:5-methylcytosine-specific restriction protein B